MSQMQAQTMLKHIFFSRRKLKFINSDSEIKSVKKIGYRLEK